MLTEQNVRAGMSPGDARRAALRAFGRVESGEGRRAARRGCLVWPKRSSRTFATARRARGAIPASPWLSSLTMAMGIGANTAIFSVVNGVCSARCPSRTVIGSSSCISSSPSPASRTWASRSRKCPTTGRPRSARGLVEFHTCGSSCSASPNLRASPPACVGELLRCARV